ncbi:hypothetical protein BO94DRAFT_599288 [Aspergillus sclerotioniger CBS 115572]|uniref:Alcohol acetyltransferase n=1 Tax=Aspergillus sclerotioniger CBS 115572 TaxID=1450535 RepID=A0A317WBM6_9EURO|nr:hypothetical protein BO94DRAFT_599288 [Aspergillus sclerotioniger CBS 115572]PWY83844.1 hypothetical protein BO94DRAFT_599288 [Aspergillus sclerotioniger CBS 115572]
MMDVHQLEQLRPLGKLEQVAACCHHIDFFNNVGLSAHYKFSDSSPGVSNLRGLVYATIGAVVRQHRILAAIIVDEDAPSPHFASLPVIDLARSVTFLERSQPLPEAVSEDKELDAILEYQHNTNFKSEYGTLPFWRLIILQSPGVSNEFTASFIYHHAIGDGVSGMAFHHAFRQALEVASSNCLTVGEAENIIFGDENGPVLPSLEELHPLPIQVPPSHPSAANLKEWTGGPVHIPCTSRWASMFLSSDTSRGFIQDCKNRNVTVTSALTSIVATILFENLPSDVEAVTCIIPVNLRPWLRLPRQVADRAIGSYFDVTRARIRRPARNLQDHVWSSAAQVSQTINKYLSNISPSGEPYTSIAIFNTIPDVSAMLKSMIGNPRDAALEVTNIGVFSRATPFNREEIPLWHVTKVLLSRSSPVTGAAITDGDIALGFSWQEGIVPPDLIGNVRQGVRKHLERKDKGREFSNLDD